MPYIFKELKMVMLAIMITLAYTTDPPMYKPLV